MDGIDYRSLPVVLLAATWAAFDVVLKGYEIINKRKDLILTGASSTVNSGVHLTQAALNNMLLWDYVPLAIGITVFCLIFFVLILQVPRFYFSSAKYENPREDPAWNTAVRKAMSNACLCVSLLALFGALAFAAGSVADVLMLHAEIGRMHNP